MESPARQRRRGRVHQGPQAEGGTSGEPPDEDPSGTGGNFVQTGPYAEQQVSLRVFLNYKTRHK